MGKQCWSQAVLESGSWGHSVLQTPALVVVFFLKYNHNLIDNIILSFDQTWLIDSHTAYLDNTVFFHPLYLIYMYFSPQQHFIAYQ